MSRHGLRLRRLLAHGCWLAAATTLWARAARAADTASIPASAVHLEVEAAASCATREGLAARVAARSQRIQFLDDGPDVTTLRAQIAPGPNDAVFAQLTIVDPHGRRFSRHLSAPTCAEAVDAVALIAVISLDPTYSPSASVGAGARSEQGSPVPPSGSRPSEAAQNPPAASTASRASQTDTASRADADRRSPAAAQPSRPARRRLGADAAAQLTFGPAPRVMAGVAIRAVVSWDRDSIWSPAARLTAAHAWLGGVAEPGGTAAFALDTLGLDVCPIRLAVPIVALRGCASALAGRLSATGSNTYSPTSQERPFVALGGSAILSAALGANFELAATFAAGDALIRDSFEFSPQVFHRVSAMTLTIDLGLGLRFP